MPGNDLDDADPGGRALGNETFDGQARRVQPQTVQVQPSLGRRAPSAQLEPGSPVKARRRLSNHDW